MKKSINFLIIFLIILLNTQIYPFQVINKIVAVVGDKFLTLYDLEKLCEPFYQRFVNPALPLEEKEKIKDEIKKELLERWIEDTLLEIEAEKYGLEVSDEEVGKYLENEIILKGGEKKIEKFLNSQGLTYEEYKKRIKNQLLKIKLIQLQIKGKVLVTDEELKQAYQNLIKNYSNSTKYVLSILIIPENEILAKSIYEEILKGKNFAEIYKTFPEIKYIKKESFKEDEMAPEILEKLKQMKINEISLIKREDSFYIVKLLDMKKDIPPSFSEVKDKLYRKLFEKKAQVFIENWIKELKEKRYIRIYL